MKIQPLGEEKSGLDHKDWRKLKRLDTPVKVQAFLDKLAFNLEERGETHHSPKLTLKAGKAHCFEGALLAAAAFWINGEKPLLLDLKTIRPDFDHVVALFKIDGFWGAVSKTNHAVLRYRDPIYKNIRELSMSYFHEYFLEDGRKTLRKYSEPYDLSKQGIGWIVTEDNLAELAHQLDQSPHISILSPKQARNLRRAGSIEIKALDIVEYS